MIKRTVHKSDLCGLLAQKTKPCLSSGLTSGCLNIYCPDFSAAALSSACRSADWTRSAQYLIVDAKSVICF